MKIGNYEIAVSLLAALIFSSGLAAAQVSESTTIYASLPAKIEITVPAQYKDLQMGSCDPGKPVSVAGGIEIKSNTNWGLMVAGSTLSGHMVGSSGTPAHELHSPMIVKTNNPEGGPVSLPGTGSSPSSIALLSNILPGEYAGTGAIGLSFEQFFGWNDAADSGYQITVTLTAAPA